MQVSCKSIARVCPGRLRLLSGTAGADGSASSRPSSFSLLSGFCGTRASVAADRRDHGTLGKRARVDSLRRVSPKPTSYSAPSRRLRHRPVFRYGVGPPAIKSLSSDDGQHSAPPATEGPISVVERDGDDISLAWRASSRLVELATEHECINSRVLLRPGEFCGEASLPKRRIRGIQAFGDRHGVGLSQLMSLRSQILVDKTMFVHAKVGRKARLMHRQYHSGKSVLDISQQTNLPPLAIFRAIMKLDHPEWEFMAGEFKKPWKHLTVAIRSPEEWMTSREQVELRECSEMDLSSTAEGDRAQESGRNFEMHLQEVFRDLEIPFTTEAEIKADPERKRGGGTPDFVFKDCSLTINGKQVDWIDAKCMYGAGTSKIIMKKLKKQAKMYSEAFGRGAFVFGRGHCSSLHVDGAFMLDWDPDFDAQRHDDDEQSTQL